ncbi:MAG: autotransporter subunit C [Oleispira sp.]
MSSANGPLLCNLARFSQKILIPLFTIFSLFLSINTLAANGVDNLGRVDYDLDDDGLIEINDLADLDEIRNNLDGKTLYSSNVGCPNAEDGTLNGGCIGFELTTDLDFDTSGDGLVDANDDYWNPNVEGGGEGWLPIGSYGNYFSAQFNGNGHVINDLTINRPTNYVGLFGAVRDSRIENLVIAGPNTWVAGRSFTAVLVGLAYANTQILNIVVVADVSGDDYVAGLVGKINSSTQVENSSVSGSVSGDLYIGGLVGHIATRYDSSLFPIKKSLSTSNIRGNRYVGGLVGYSEYRGSVHKSYWAEDTSGQSYSAGSSEANSYVGLSLSTLRCANAENSDHTSGCVSADGSGEGLNATMVLYKDWDPAVWDFGIAPNANQQLPGLKFNGQVYRDSDGDGSLDADDVWPNNPAASQDLDGDGYPDSWSFGCDDTCIQISGLTLDQFPHHARAVRDADFDGQPDGVENCTAHCQLDGLTKDGSLGDYDNDGILDAVDNDENNDGIPDIDADHDGLVDIDSLDKLNAMRFQLQGLGLQLTDVASVETSGCPFVIYQGVYQKRCSGYELIQDLDFDSNADGTVDSLDAYWNENAQGLGEGWLPVGSSYNNYFRADFNGNGHAIKNLTINRTSTNHIGLFGMVRDARIENLVIAGPNTSISGGDDTAALVGYSLPNTQIRNTVVVADVSGGSSVAGLVGFVSSGTQIENSFVSGSVSGDFSVAGLVGRNNTASISINKTLSTSVVRGNTLVGGLVGHSDRAGVVHNSYWAKDASTQRSSSNRSEANSYVGLNLAILQCAIAENTDHTSGCVSADGSGEGLNATMVLYKDWDPAVWDFGTNEQLPGLKINGQIYRDGDGDGALDRDDIWPDNRAASKDSDNDGYPDAWSLNCDDACIQYSGLTLDKFPQLAGAWLDADHDGLVDEINLSCAVNCAIPAELIDFSLDDFDNDTILDAVDTDEDNDDIDDIDADHDGLIDINSLEKLNAMRFQLQGFALQLLVDTELNSSGCPFVYLEGVYQRRCHGYELTQDLDFDTNADGLINSLDEYWNENEQGIGEGWLPVGASDNSGYFTSTFNGNGHVIKNLTINRPSTSSIGLFGVIQGARIENLGIAGFSSSVIGRNSVGTLVGQARSDSHIRKIFISAYVQGGNSVGGLVGSIGSTNRVENIFTTGVVDGISTIAGVVGHAGSGSNSIKQVLSLSLVSGNRHQGGVVGYSTYGSDEILNSYWAKGISTQNYSSRESISKSYMGLSFDTLQCAVVENTDASTGCVSADGRGEGLTGTVVLYKDWDASIWDFGTSQQLPGFKFGGKVLRDSDGDGVFDGDDLWPNNRAVSLDSDGDGYPDAWSLNCDDLCIDESGFTLDQFPNHDWAYLDADHDGLVDGAENCTSDCEFDGLKKDDSLADFDNDGILDIEDGYSGNDGVLDIDADHDGLIDIDSLEKLNAMRFQVRGVGLQLTDDSAVNISGCPFAITRGVYQQRCSGYELIQDLDFDTNKNGLIDSGDGYWNENIDGVSEGWLPFGDSYNPFSAVFNGNGYVINNLTINRPMTNYIGLFGHIQNATIENVRIAGVHSSITGDDYVGALIGYATERNLVRNIHVTANVSGDQNVGGIVGQAYVWNGTFSTQVNNSFISGSVEGKNYVGALAGRMHSSVTTAIHTVDSVLSTALVQGSGDGNAGGIIGSGYNSSVTNSYWAKDASTQSGSSGAHEANSYVGLNLTKLQCASSENTDSSTGCVSADGSDENLNTGITLYKNWDPVVWDFGTSEQLPGLKFNGQVIRDGDGDGFLDANDILPFDHDNDGVVDGEDAHPLIFVSVVDDIDRDGKPNECLQVCIDLGMTPDSDDDGDGILDLDDAYQFISLGGLSDFDNDGRPDVCDQACIALGMVVDTDSDNDGIENNVDAFEFNAAASLDADGDGLPDEWNENCLTLECQTVSGLTQDQLLNDYDNDGVSDDVDTDFERDNGKPTLLTTAPAMHTPVNTEDDSAFIASVEQVNQMFAALSATDLVDDDSSLTFKAYLNNVELVRDVEGQVTLPSGLQIINWVAVDQAGNESEPLEQQLFVYPKVRFKTAASTIGEASNAEIIVELSGDSPEYPVIVEVQINAEASSLNQADVNATFDISSVHTLKIEQGDDAELLNRQVSLLVPIIEDDQSENDELVVVELNSVLLKGDDYDAFLIDDSRKAHELTVTYQNLAPQVQLLMKQAGLEVGNVQQDSGNVTITAIITDGNGADEHSVIWDLNSLGLNAPLGRELTFSPANLPEGVYMLSVTVTDDHIVNPLSTGAAINIQLVAPVVIDPPVTEPVVDPGPDAPDTSSGGSSGGGGGGGGGGAIFWLLILMSWVLVYSNRKYKH